ncbi:hypothetical protein [Kribbella sp. NBC_00359]|uniref:hypothetical protein n=1 Tax=Kribbella sp. NBC_00359 TaxID=2975966 RepID=UPI002E1B7AB8
MYPQACQSLRVVAAVLGGFFSMRKEALNWIGGDHELQLISFVMYEIDGKLCDVLARINAEKPDEGKLSVEATPQCLVLRVVRVTAAILISEQAINASRVGVGRRSTRWGVGRAEGERGIEDGWLPYAAAAGPAGVSVGL